MELAVRYQQPNGVLEVRRVFELDANLAPYQRIKVHILFLQRLIGRGNEIKWHYQTRGSMTWGGEPVRSIGEPLERSSECCPQESSKIEIDRDIFIFIPHMEFA